MINIKGILFDFIGTTVIEKDPSVVNRCFQMAFEDHGIMVNDEVIVAGRGKDKAEMITGVLNQFDHPFHLVVPILDSFRKHLEDNMDNFFANDEAVETINYMKNKKIIVGLGTGLPRDVFEKIFAHLRWSTGWFDYIGIAEEVGRGRPHPDMILDMMNKCELDPGHFLKVGDTIADIREGKNAKVLTAVILSGTQPRKSVLAEHPDFVIDTLEELKGIINGEKC